MPPITRFRRRSSVRLNGLSLSSIKPGNYGISPRNISFAPNVTPISYTAPEDEDDDLYLPSPSASHSPSDNQTGPTKLFPPSSTPAPPPTRKRCPPGKRRSQGYIPRPPNAFMLFRADFVRQKHVPGSIETNHGSLSKIIGNCWRALPLEEKKIWEVKARHEKAAHKLAYPDYRFRPVHNKNKDKDKDGVRGGDAARKAGRAGQGQEEDERRCEEVAQLLLEGKKGEELALAVKHLDQAREASSQENSPISAVQQLSLPPPSHQHQDLVMPVPMQASFLQPLPQSNGMYHRRSSSVPLSNDYFLAQYANTAQNHHPIPSLPFAFTQTLSRPTSPVPSISRHFHAQPQGYQHPPTGFAPFPNQTQVQNNRASFLSSHRRASSVGGPFLRRSWTLPSGWGSSMGIEEYGMDLSSMVDMGDYMGMGGVGMGMNTMPLISGMDYTGMQMDRDPSPLPEVDNSLFSDFTFASSSAGAAAVGGMMKDEHPPPTVAVAPATQEEGIAPHAPSGLHLEIDPTHSWAYDPSISSASTSLSTSTATSVYSDPGSPPYTTSSTPSSAPLSAPDKTPTTGEFSMSLSQMDMGIGMDHNHSHAHAHAHGAIPSYEAWTQQHQDGFAQGGCHDQFGMGVGVGVGMGMEGNTEGGFGAFGQGYGL